MQQQMTKMKKITIKMNSETYSKIEHPQSKTT